MRFSFLIVMTLAFFSCPDISSADDVGKWDRWESAFTASDAVPDAADVSVTLTSPSGKSFQRRTFWDGGHTWKVRFQPNELGTWKFKTTSPKNYPGLSDQTGSFQCVKNAGQTIFQKHGPVEVSDNGRYLQHADGTPFFWLADTAWNGALLSDEQDWNTYLSDRQAKHFTAIQLVTTQWRTAYQNPEGQVAYEGRDSIKIHPEFFQRLDARIDAVNQHNLLAALVMLWALGEESYTPGKLPTDQAIKLAQYIEARYGGNDVLWILGGDENYSGKRADHWKAIGQAVFGDRQHAPVTLHPQGMQWQFDAFANEKWLDLLIYQSGHGDNSGTLAWIHSGPPSQKWKQSPARPIINSEPPYEGHIAYQTKQPHTAYNVRRAAYWSLLNAPTAGVSYGAHGVWSWETKPNTPLNHGGSGLAKPWQEAIHLPGSTDMSYLAQLFTRIDWWKLRPAAEVLQSPSGKQDPAQHVSVSKSDSGDLLVAYLPVGGKVVLDMAQIPGVKKFTWFDPRTGKRTLAKAKASGEFAAPDDQDWVLLGEA
ncbi:DUF4038 domain-containing protein [Blastopirellula marina]|uniref:DUF4038 domain-containing protein n=1 Tax=Blastopirellula marina TaxID=124 RepID=A0A2S8F498_9BACT|nr:DUF4038 domain-containing protein [Blastopirellula marina]PQO26995.1 hypothetical protein C5Y98_27440 [Blastopirellula marina]PTL41142.1 DUF4038 domain-containing protein [Blastopirellula marina]